MSARESAEHWDKLADGQEEMANWEDSIGRPYGDTSSYRVKAESYRRTAKSLWLEAETGKIHCSICLGHHANHEHMHRG
jgi:hypothetical protein